LPIQKGNGNPIEAPPAPSGSNRANSRAEADIGHFKGIKPSVSGCARIVGHNTIFVDDRYPLAYGFQIK